MQQPPNSATEQKDKHYALLARRINTMSAHLAQSAQLLEGLKYDLEGMKTFAGLHAAQFMAMSRLLDTEELARQEQAEKSHEIATTSR